MTRAAKITLWAVAGTAIVLWPIAVLVYVLPALRRYWPNDGRVTLEDLQVFTGIRRYYIDIPPEADGWFLGLGRSVNGGRVSGGGVTARGGARVVLLVQRTDDGSVRYAWHGNEQGGSGMVGEVFPYDSLVVSRQPGEVQPGDWLFRGEPQGGTVSSGDEHTAKYEVRVTLTPPYDPGTEQDVAPEPPTAPD